MNLYIIQINKENKVVRYNPCIDDLSDHTIDEILERGRLYLMSSILILDLDYGGDREEVRSMIREVKKRLKLKEYINNL